MELNDFSWETFSHTGNIDAYLLYKSIADLNRTKDKEEEWQTSTREVSL
ncbi:MAG: YqzL family protein [Oscillospiraceae bacterium]|nr:YqzL family protein [Oscillospiraceae bacterium]